MYLLLKNSLFVILILFIYGCVSTKSNFVKTNDINSVSIETSGDRDNILFKEHLIRIFNTKRNAIPKFKLKATISFSSSDTLTVSGLNALSRTLANVSYKLYNFKSKKLYLHLNIFLRRLK